MDDPVITLMARLVVQMHGNGAAFFAAQNAELEVANGDHVGAALWKKIQNAIDELQSAVGAGSQTLN